MIMKGFIDKIDSLDYDGSDLQEFEFSDLFISDNLLSEISYLKMMFLNL